MEMQKTRNQSPGAPASLPRSKIVALAATPSAKKPISRVQSPSPVSHTNTPSPSTGVTLRAKRSTLSATAESHKTAITTGPVVTDGKAEQFEENRKKLLSPCATQKKAVPKIQEDVFTRLAQVPIRSALSRTSSPLRFSKAGRPLREAPTVNIKVLSQPSGQARLATLGEERAATATGKELSPPRIEPVDSLPFTPTKRPFVYGVRTIPPQPATNLTPAPRKAAEAAEAERQAAAERAAAAELKRKAAEAAEAERAATVESATPPVPRPLTIAGPEAPRQSGPTKWHLVLDVTFTVGSFLERADIAAVRRSCVCLNRWLSDPVFWRELRLRDHAFDLLYVEKGPFSVHADYLGWYRDRCERTVALNLAADGPGMFGPLAGERERAAATAAELERKAARAARQLERLAAFEHAAATAAELKRKAAEAAEAERLTAAERAAATAAELKRKAAEAARSLMMCVMAALYVMVIARLLMQ